MSDFHYPDAKFICAVKEIGTIKDILSYLGLGASSINVYTKRIEERFQKQLFVRNKKTKTIELNEHGLDLYPICKKMLTLVSSLDELAEPENGLLQGEIKLTATNTLLKHFCLPYFVDFADKNPNLNISIRQLDEMLCIDQSLNEFYFTSEVNNDGDVYTYFPYHAFVQKLWASEIYLKKRGQIKNVHDLYRHTLLFQRGIIGNNKAVGVPAQIKAKISYTDIRTYDISGSGAVDFLCEAGLGIMNGSEETTKLSGLKVSKVLEKVEGETIKVYIKASQKFMSKRAAKEFMNWLFDCRDKTLKKAGIKPAYPYKKL